MSWRKLGLLTFVALILAVVVALTWKKRRPANVPAAAVLVNGSYIECPRSHWGFGVACKVYDGSTGQLLNADPFAIRLKVLATKHGGAFVDCGKTSFNAVKKSVAECAKAALQNRKPFAAEYITDWGGGLSAGYAVLGDADGNVASATYDSRGFPDVRPTTRTELFDGDRVRLTTCIPPVQLGETDNGVIICIAPVNEKASADAAQQKIVDTTVCAIAQNPTDFNNRLVRIHGSASGNFEYSMLSGDGCPSEIWFTYADDAPPGLVAHVPGAALPGGEDADGRRILPVPIKLVEDADFRRFQRLMRERAKQDEISTKRSESDYVSHEVAATFVGRIDAVSQEVHQFHLKRSVGDRADYLGFGQMGLFDVQFVMRSVGNDAKLESKHRGAEVADAASKQ